MTELGADYSWARPGGAALAAAGVVSVGRYLAPAGDGREIEADEFADLRANGLSVWFVREGAADGILGGYSQGVYDAQVAEANLARIGQQGSVVYAAADFDVQDGQFAACDDYMRGFASVLGLQRVGIYAGLHYINHVRASLAVWYWQAGATSWNHGEGGAVHIEQTTQLAPVTGSDHNIIYELNHGQSGFVPPTPEPVRRYDVTTVYENSDASPNKYILAGDSVGTTANWIETTNVDLAKSWIASHGPSVTISAATYTNFKKYYLMPVANKTTAEVSVNMDTSALTAAVQAGVTAALAGRTLTSTIN